MTKEFFDTATLILGENARKIIGAYSIYLRFTGEPFGENEIILQSISVYQQCRELPIVKLGEEGYPFNIGDDEKSQQVLDSAYKKISSLSECKQSPFPMFTPEEADVIINVVAAGMIDSPNAYMIIDFLIHGGDVLYALGEDKEYVVNYVRSWQRKGN